MEIDDIIETGDFVQIKDSDDDTIYEAREDLGHRDDHHYNVYWLKEVDNDEAEEIGPYQLTSLVKVKDEPIKSRFPRFKSYGLTKEQVFEVVMLFMTHMAELHKDLAEEAMADNNYQWATDYFKECQAFLNVKILEDKIWYRFVEE